MASFAACPSGSGDGGDAGVACSTVPTSMLNLFIKAATGPVPHDLTLQVSWSAGEEPPFELDDPSTWGSLAQGSNVVCDVQANQPPPAELPCHLWTSGATKVKLDAAGYLPYEATLKPKNVAECKGPVPTDVHVTLTPEAGAGGSS